MKIRLTICFVITVGLLLVPVARAAPPTKVQTEVNFLLGYVEGSGCDFLRNGTWYDSISAQVHLRDKYRYLAAENQINTTEDFIEKVATRSSFSGLPYEVRCNGGTAVMSEQWLRNELTHFRTLN